MLIALQKRHENIAEYILYMWQVEDLLRVCQFDDTQIEQRLVNRFAGIEGVDDTKLADIRRWYFELRDMLLGEGKRETGHLQITETVITDLTDLHLRLLRHGQDAIYTSCYYSTLPLIVELRSREGEEKTGELATCFTALYGLMLLRMQGREVSSATSGAMQQISKFLGLLAAKYKAWKAGELELDEEG